MLFRESHWTTSDRFNVTAGDRSELATVNPALFFSFLLFLSPLLASCSGAPVPRPDFIPGYPVGYAERGIASWYGPGFHGNKTSSGERYDMHRLTAAHRTLPLGSVVAVRCVKNGRTVTVRINDRGPFAKSRIIDLSYEAAKTLAMIGPGTEEVDLKVIGYEGRPGAFGYLRVQVGSYSELGNANAMVAKLRSQYAGARILMIELPEGRRYRVQVGEFASEREAQEVADRIAAVFQLSPIVLRDDV